MKADAYRTELPDTYLFVPEGKPASSIPKAVFHRRKPVFLKTVEIKPHTPNITINRIRATFKVKGYAIRVLSPGVLESLRISETLNNLISAALTPQWFAIFLGLTYVAGFLSVFTFLDRFGIHDGEEFIRSKCLHAGILFLLFPVSILLPIILQISLKNFELKEQSSFRFPLSTMLSFLNVCLLFYVLIFTPANFFLARIRWIAVATFATFVGPLISDLVFRRCGNMKDYFRWFFCGLSFVMDAFIFDGFWERLGVILFGYHPFLSPDGAIWYFAFMLLIPYVLWRINQHAGKLRHERSQTEMRILGASFVMMFMFLGIMSFALRAYPHIAVAKGGGNYSESPLVSLSFRTGTGSTVNTSDATILSLSFSNCFIIIERTPTSLYLANTNDAQGPSNWVYMRKLPEIIEVRRDTIDRISYTAVADTNF